MIGRLMTSRVRAFTVVELLVVMVIIVLLLGLAVPATRSILDSSRRSRGVNALSNSLRSARDAAVRSPAGDAAAVFLFDKSLGVVVQTCVQVGTLEDRDANNAPVTRDVFVPSGVYEPIVVPEPWAVRGFSPAGSISDDWYGGPLYDGSTDNNGHWVFPLNHTYDPTRLLDGEYRATFMVRFRAGSGELVRSAAPALVVDPSPSGKLRSGVVNPESALQVTNAESLDAWATNVLASPFLSDLQRRNLIGRNSADTVLAGPVSELSLYDEREMQIALRLRGFNREYGSIYTINNSGEPVFDDELATSAIDDAQSSNQITDWIQALAGIQSGSADPLSDSGDWDGPQVTRARIFFVNPYSGRLVEVEP